MEEINRKQTPHTQNLIDECARFLDYLKFEKRYSPHTILSYGDDLTQFKDYVEMQFGALSIHEISTAMVRSWLASLKDAGLKSRSIVRKISTLRSFFLHGVRTGTLKKTPMSGVIAPRMSSRLPVYVEEKDMDHLFTSVHFDADWRGQTAKLVLTLLYQLGLRCAELVNCRESHIDFANRQIKVIGKGSKERIIPIDETLVKDLGHYVAEKRKLFGDKAQPHLLATDKGKPLYSKYVHRVTTRYLPLVTTISKTSPHVLRHSFATHLSNNGAELHAIRELLGHASLAATQIYTHNTIEKLKNVHKKAHPRG